MNVMMKKSLPLKVTISLLISSSLFLSSCATQKAVARGKDLQKPLSAAEEKNVAEAADQKEQSQGIFHIVKKDENLYRIAKTYGIDLKTLAELNDITDPSKLYVGQPIFIPGAMKQLPVPIIKKGEPAPFEGGKFIWPVSGKVSSHFGDKRNGHYHSGIDILAPYGTEVVASRDGVVRYSGLERGYGRMVVIDHEDGSSTVYAHNSANLVEAGKRVSRGDAVARVGTSGNASGSHIHFEIRVGNNSIDPLGYLE